MSDAALAPCLSSSLLNEKMTCELCQGVVIKPAPFSGFGISGDMSMRRHLKKCRHASKSERSFFKMHRRWPRKD